MADQRPRMSDAEFAAWRESVRRKNAAAPDPPVQVVHRACERCGGVGFVRTELHGWIRCSNCNATGSAVVARARKINRASEAKAKKT